jgi:glutamate-1-semialdehyde 2,1-aminomutase
MDFLAPLGPVYQAGTLSGNPLAMAAGIATIAHLIEHENTVYPQLERVTQSIAEGVAELARQAGVPLATNRAGSMFTWFFTAGPVTDYASASASDTTAFGRFHRSMLESGVWLPPSQFEAAFVSTSHGQMEVDRILAAARTALTA